MGKKKTAMAKGNGILSDAKRKGKGTMVLWTEGRHDFEETGNSQRKRRRPPKERNDIRWWREGVLLLALMSGLRTDLNLLTVLEKDSADHL